MRFLVILIVATAAWECGVTPDFEVELQPTSPLKRRISERRLSLNYTRAVDTFTPLRIHVEYLPLQLSSELETELKETIMPGALTWFSRSLSVNAVVGRLKLDITTCSAVPVPQAHRTVGVEADYILYVYGIGVAYPYVARAGACAYEDGSRNYPVAGMMELNTLNYGSALTVDMRVEVIIHEMTHALGFTPSIWRKFVNTDGLPYSTYNVTVSKRGADRVILTFPTVVAKAREHFGCETLEGGELEDAGGSGTASAHWEKRIFGNEYMVGSIAALDFGFSEITLALFADSGFYHVDFTYATPFSWGRNQGCSFHTTACVVDGVPQFPEFCDTIQEGCEYNYLNVAKCNIYTDLTLPVYNQYYSDPTKGGPDSLGDYCPVYSAYSNTKCKISYVSRSYRVQTSSPKSRCLQGTWGLGKNTAYQVGSCHEIDCIGGQATIHLDSDNSVACPVDGGTVTLTSPYVGQLPCPSYSTLCQGVPCMAACLGRGICGAGICACDAGFSGQRCENKCNIRCKSCSADDASTCQTCTSNAHLSGSTCGCDTGYKWTLSGACVATACAAWCQTCSESVCQECWPNASMVAGSCVCDDGYFPNSDGSLCTACGGSCRKCFGPKANQCTACYDGAWIYTTGECACKAGYFTTSDATACLLCDPTCNTCSGSGTMACTSCYSPALLAGTQACMCPTGYYLGTGGLCAKCSSRCWACTDGTTCTACATGASLSGTTCVCSSGTPSPYCPSSCDVSCKTCAGASATECSTCYSLASVTSAPGACVCKTGYIASPTSNTCQACTYPCTTCLSTSSMDCLTCTSSRYLLDSGSVCVSRCPYGYDTSTGACVARPGKVFDMSLTGYTNYPVDSVSGRLGYSGTSTYFYPTPDNGDPRPAPNNGWVFDGISDYIKLPPNTNDTTNLVFAPTHYLELWVKPTNTTRNRKCLLTKRASINYYSLCYSTANTLTLEMQIKNFIDPLITNMTVFDAGTVSLDSKWQLVSYQLTYTNKASTLTFYMNAVQMRVFQISNGIFLDYSGQSSFLLGAYDLSYSINDGFEGNIAQLVIYQGVQVTPVLKSNCGCSSCSSSGNCLSKCTITQAEVDGSCASCLSTCTQGCYRPTDCSLNQDPLCASYTNSTSCSACVPYASSVNGVCACVSHASPSTSGTACSCITPYQGNAGVSCVACKKYFAVGEVTATYDSLFTRVLIRFDSVVDTSGFQSCASFVSPQSLLKLGSNPTCTWSDGNKLVTILLGQSASLVQEPIALLSNYLFTALDTTTCGYLPVDLAPIVNYPGAPPAPIALITAPRTFGLNCNADLIISGEMSSGVYSRTMTFMWTLTSDPPNSSLPPSASLNGLSVVIIPAGSLVPSTLSILLNVQNGFGLNATDYMQIRISNDFIGVQISGGNNQTVEISSNPYQFIAEFDSRCGFQGTPSFSWDYIGTSTDETPKNALSGNGRIRYLDSSKLTSDRNYLFNVSMTLGSASGYAILSVTIVKPALVVKMFPSSGTYPISLDLVLSASQSSDPALLPGALSYHWYCTESTQDCKAADGSALLTSYVNADSTLSSSRLRLGATYTFTVVISKDTRSVNDTRQVTIVTGNGCSVQLPVAFLRLSEGKSLRVVPSVSAVSSASFQWAQIGGPSVSIKHSSATYMELESVQGGYSYAFQLNVINNGVISAYFNISGNLPPWHGSLSISPSSGTALTTYFRLSAAAWEDPEGTDYPLTYQFLATLTSSMTISAQSLSNSLTTKLGLGTTRVQVSVCDSLDGCVQTYMPVSLQASSRRLVITIASFQDDIVDASLTPSMIVAYSASLELDLPVLQSMQSALEAYTASSVSVDSTLIDTALSSLESMATQTILVANMTTTWVNYMVALMQRAGSVVSTQATRALTLLHTVRRPSSALGPIKWLITSLSTVFENNQVPDSSPFTYTSDVYSMSSSRLIASELNGLKVSIGNGYVSFPENFTRYAGLSNTQVIDLLFAHCNQTDAVAEVAWTEIRTAGSYSLGSLSLTSASNYSNSNLGQALNYSFPAVLNPNSTYECLWQSGNGDWKTSCTVLNFTSSSALLSVSYIAPVSLRLYVEDIAPPPTPTVTDPTSDCETVTFTQYLVPIGLLIALSGLALLLLLITVIVDWIAAVNRKGRPQKQNEDQFHEVNLHNIVPPADARDVALHLEVQSNPPEPSHPQSTFSRFLVRLT